MRDHRKVIKAIIFDLGRVIVPFDFNRSFERMSPLCGVPAHQLPALIFPTGLVRQFESGQLEAREFVGLISKHLKLKSSYEEFCEIWSSIFLPETLISEALLASLAKKYRLVLLSNTNSIHFEMIAANYPLLRHFHSYVLSYEVGAMKPEHAIYARAIEEAGCLPKECFFTDDIAEYVEGAKREGIDAVQFESEKQIESELHARGVRWD